MKDMKLENIWKEKSQDAAAGIHYSREQISGLRKKRERQLTGSVKSAVITGLSIKFILLLAIVVFSILAFDLSNLRFAIVALFIITSATIIYDFYLLRLVSGINNYSDNIESRLGKLNDFLAVHFPVFQVENALSAPIFVISGMFYYHFLKYSGFEFRAVDDIIVFILVTLISYTISFFGTKYSLSSFRREALELLGAGEDSEAMIHFEERRKKNRRRLVLISLLLLLSGLILFALILFT
jgi:hypothetical protein